MTPGTGFFLPRAGAQRRSSSGSASATTSPHSSASSSWDSGCSPCTRTSDGSGTTNSGGTTSGISGGDASPRLTVRRVPWPGRGGSDAGAAPGTPAAVHTPPAASARGPTSAGLFAPASSGASSFAVTELDDAAAFLSTSNSLPACPPGAGDAWGSRLFGSTASSAGMEAPPAQPRAAWLPALAGGGLGEPGLGLPATAGGSSSVLIQLPPASMPAALGAPGSVGGLGLGAAVLTPELGSSSSSSASLAGWPGAASGASGPLLTLSSGSLQLADGAADAGALHLLAPPLPPPLPLIVGSPVQLLACQQQQLPAMAPAAPADGALRLAQAKLGQLAAVRAMEEQLTAEVIALLQM